MADLRRELFERLQAAGFTMAGVVAARPGQHLAAYLAWLEQGYQGEMGYLSRPDRVARRQDLNLILRGVQSLICVGLDYATFQLPPEIANDPGRGRIANYAWGKDYHPLMASRLEEVARWLGSHGHCKVYVDTGAILERDHGVAAGLGFVGKNSMLIAPRRGSWLFLGQILTTLPLEADRPAAMPACGRCQRCLTACPTQAFPQPYILDARRCISYLTIELKGWIPGHLRPLMGNWVYGCDICQEVCPFNRFASPSQEVAFRPEHPDFAAPPLLHLLALDEANFARQFANSPIQRIKRERLVRNSCVAAGNWGHPAAVPALTPLLGDNSELVRGHAAWALGQIGGDPAGAALHQALPHESSSLVQAEISLALQKIG